MAISIPDVLFAYLFSHKKGTTTKSITRHHGLRPVISLLCSGTVGVKGKRLWHVLVILNRVQNDGMDVFFPGTFVPSPRRFETRKAPERTKTSRL